MIYLNIMMFVVAAAVAYVSYLSYRINREKFRLDLFEKRYAVFRAVTRHLAKAGEAARLEWSDLSEYLGATADVQFLFDEDIAVFVDEVYRDSGNLVVSTAKLDGNVTDEPRDKIVEESSLALDSLMKKLQEAKHLFSPYLAFKKS